jgi:excisionase family DNA binding protein
MYSCAGGLLAFYGDGKKVKAELTLPTELVGQIFDMFIEKLSPLLNGNGKNRDDGLFDVEDLALYLKVNRQWVYEKIHNNSVPHYKMGKYPRFRKSEIDQWLRTLERGEGRKPAQTVRRLLEVAP